MRFKDKEVYRKFKELHLILFEKKVEELFPEGQIKSKKDYLDLKIKDNYEGFHKTYMEVIFKLSYYDAIELFGTEEGNKILQGKNPKYLFTVSDENELEEYKKIKATLFSDMNEVTKEEGIESISDIKNKLIDILNDTNI